MMNADSLLGRLLAPAGADGRVYGVVVGLVTDNRDPDGLHRVRLRLPWLGDGDETHWARVASPMAGADRGAYFLPEIDDEVLVAFEHGSVDHPFVVGSLWNGRDRPPENNAGGRNDHRGFTSRSGHVLRLGDAAGDERVEIIDKTGGNRIVITSRDNAISIEATGDISIVSSTGKLTLSARDVEIRSQTGVAVQAGTTVDVQAGAQVAIQGALVKLN